MQPSALASEVGFDNVAALARESGIKSVQATPSVAIVSYGAPPLDGWRVHRVRQWRCPHRSLDAGQRSHSQRRRHHRLHPTSKQVLYPRVAYLTTNLMEGVMNFGYGYEVRKRGFTEPAVGKTGTSHDAWFAGYTTNLICIVWVGNEIHRRQLVRNHCPRYPSGRIHEARRQASPVL